MQINRRKFVSLFGITTLAGCASTQQNSNRGNSRDATEKSDNTSSSTETRTPKQPLIASSEFRDGSLIAQISDPKFVEYVSLLSSEGELVKKERVEAGESSAMLQIIVPEKGDDGNIDSFSRYNQGTHEIVAVGSNEEILDKKKIELDFNLNLKVNIADEHMIFYFTNTGTAPVPVGAIIAQGQEYPFFENEDSMAGAWPDTIIPPNTTKKVQGFHLPNFGSKEKNHCKLESEDNGRITVNIGNEEKRAWTYDIKMGGSKKEREPDDPDNERFYCSDPEITNLKKV